MVLLGELSYFNCVINMFSFGFKKPSQGWLFHLRNFS